MTRAPACLRALVALSAANLYAAVVVTQLLGGAR